MNRPGVWLTGHPTGQQDLDPGLYVKFDRPKGGGPFCSAMLDWARENMQLGTEWRPISSSYQCVIFWFNNYQSFLFFKLGFDLKPTSWRRHATFDQLPEGEVLEPFLFIKARDFLDYHSVPRKERAVTVLDV